MALRERLPQPVRTAGGAARNRLLNAAVRRLYAWEGDGFATSHLSPFLHDEDWLRHYDQMRAGWLDIPLDVRWRMWILTQAAKQSDDAGAGFAEFGTYRGGCAYMVLACTARSRMWLYDTFEGVPPQSIGAGEEFLAGVYDNTTVDYVQQLLRPWSDRTEFVVGDVFETVPAHDPGPLSLVHMDLNAAAPTVHALEFAYERLVPGGFVVFDDYGQREFAQQRAALDDFFATRREEIIALPTGQGLVAKSAA